MKNITQACQRTCHATDGCVAFQYFLDDSRHSIICLSHLVLFYNIYSLCRDCKLLASPTSGKKIRGNYLTGLLSVRLVRPIQNAGEGIYPLSSFYLECFDFDIEYSPDGSLDSAILNDIKTMADCQKKCQDEKECKHFTHRCSKSEQVFEGQVLTYNLSLGQIQ